MKEEIIKNNRELLINLLTATLLTLIAFGIRFVILEHPNQLVFDEFYYVDAAQQIINNGVDPNWIHPHVGKYIIGLGITIFGDNSFGWRILGVILGSLTVFITYYLSLELFNKKSAAIITSILLLIDPLHFVQSRIAMLDILFLPFVVLSFYCILRHFRNYRYYNKKTDNYSKWLILSGLSIGIGLTIKWTSAFSILGLLLIYIYYTRNELEINNKIKISTKLIIIIANIILIPIIIFISSFVMDIYNGLTLKDWLTTQYSILDFHRTVESTHPYESAAWTWILNFKPIAYYVNEVDNSIIRAEGNNIAWWFALASIIYISKKALYNGKIAVTIVICVAVQYIPWFISPRITYLFYFLPSLPFIYLASTYLLLVLWSHNTKKIGLFLIIIYLISVATLFIYAFPTYIGLPR